MHASLRRWVERHPLLWAALVAVAAVAGVDAYPLVGVLGGLAGVAAICLGRRLKVALAAVAVAALAGLLHGQRLATQAAAQRWVGETGPTSATVVARILSTPQGTGGGWSALAELRDGGPPGKIWWQGGGPPPGQGATIEASGQFSAFPPPRNPGEFDVAGWLYRQGAWAVFTAHGVPRQVAPPSAFDQAGARARAWFRHAVTSGLDPASREAAVIRAMVLGEMPDDEDVMIEAYRASGTLHVFSVSGLHVAMVGLILWWALRLLGVPRRAAVLLIVAGMLGYAWITGMKPPATRAVTMAAMVVGAFLMRRRPDLLNALGVALLLAVLMDGHLLFQVGVQLSFGVVAAIGFGASRLRRPFAFLEKREPYLPLALYGRWRNGWLWLRQNAASAMGASSAASIGSLPLTLWHFGFVSPVSVLASPLIGLPVFALMTLALLATALSPFPGAQQRVNRWNAGVAWVCTKIATGFAAVPGGNVTVARDRPGKDFLIVYDPGHGGAAACLHDGGSSVSFDTAHRPGFRRIVLPSLRHLALRPESLVLSHPDGGHLGGASEALDALPVRQILLPVERARSTAFRDLVALARARGVATVLGRERTTYRISPDAWLELLHQPDPWNWHAVADERVLVTRLHWHGWRVLFTSDAGLATERAMLEAGGELSAEVIVAGRHRQDASLGDDFLAAVQPRAIVAGHADFPLAERVPAAWAAACERRGIRVFHQGRTGAVTLVVEKDGTLVLRGFLDGSELRLKK